MLDARRQFASPPLFLDPALFCLSLDALLRLCGSENREPPISVAMFSSRWTLASRKLRRGEHQSILDVD
jgi:hypothetical protein